VAQLHAPDGAALERKLEALAATVCRDDPRTKAQRRADALGALAAGADVLGCQCDGPNCPAAQRSPGTNVVIHMLAEQTTVSGDSPAPGYLPWSGARHGAAQLGRYRQDQVPGDPDGRHRGGVPGSTSYVVPAEATAKRRHFWFVFGFG
jgi:hypothetical protein